MAKLTICCFFIALTLWLVYAQEAEIQEEQQTYSLPEGCEPCDPARCTKYKQCTASVVKDRCGCCDVCGKRESELCHHSDIDYPEGEWHGRCGENLECRVRSDLEEGVKPEALCFCMIEGTLCGSNNVTYENLCHLMAAAAKIETVIKVQGKGPCKAAPHIHTPPEHHKNMTGSNIALSCEASGFPIPNIEWTWTRVDGKTEFLPNDDLRVSTLMRGGPEKWEVTGWLQIQDMQKEHEGDYTCLAQNTIGNDQATARVNVAENPEMLKNKRKNEKTDF